MNLNKMINYPVSLTSADIQDIKTTTKTLSQNAEIFCGGIKLLGVLSIQGTNKTG